MIDFHAHVLPGADHGSDSSATSAKQLGAMAAAGVTHVVATPHFYPNREGVDSFLERRSAAAGRVLKKIDPAARPTIYLGAEVLVCPGIHHMDGLDKLTIAGTKVILLEMPFTGWGSDLIDTVSEVAKTGLVPVLAHIDRYPPELMERLLRETGCAAQLNAEAFAGLFGGKTCRSYLERDVVVALGSDLHGAGREPYRPFLHMVKKLGPKAEYIFKKTAALLDGAVALTEESL